MIGISAFGLYLPAYRLTREVIAQATGGKSLSGERTVANYDEDALTMGVEASLECMDNYAHAWGVPLNGKMLRALFFASTSSPYREKHASSVISSVLEVDPTALVTDLGGSLRGGLTAMKLGGQLLKESGPDKRVLVVTADKRAAEPRSVEEQSFADGAVAVLLEQQNVVASLEAHTAVNANFPHFWRRENDQYVQSGDTRFVETYGYLPLMSEVIRDLLKKGGLKSSEVAKLIVYAPNPRLAQRLARSLGFKPETQLANTFFNNVGDTAHPRFFSA